MGKGEKGGEITSEQIVKFILPIVAFLIVLGILFYNDYRELAEEDACKLSVLGRAQSPEAAHSLIPLKCETKKICLTGGEEKCEEAIAGEENIEIIKLPKDEKKAARMIEEESALAMYECWNMMAQGKADIAGSYLASRGLEVTKPVCIICSRVTIDNNVKQGAVDMVDIQKYMKENKVPAGSLTYLQTFTDKGINAFPVVERKIFEEKVKITDEENKIIASGREIAFVFMQIKAKDVSEVLENLGKDVLIASAGSFFIPGTRGVARNIALSRSGKAVIFKILPVAIGTAGGAAAASAINAFSGQTLAAGYCGELATTPGVEKAGGGKKGCSIIEATPYDFRPINRICEVIEGIP